MRNSLGFSEKTKTLMRINLSFSLLLACFLSLFSCCFSSSLVHILFSIIFMTHKYSFSFSFWNVTVPFLCLLPSSLISHLLTHLEKDVKDPKKETAED